MSLLRGAPLPLDRVQGLSGCGLLQHGDTFSKAPKGNGIGATDSKNPRAY